MDDRRAHFLTMVGDLCSAAGTAEIYVELDMSDGSRMTGVPFPQKPDGEALGDTGYAYSLLIGGATASLDEVVGISVSSP